MVNFIVGLGLVTGIVDCTKNNGISRLLCGYVVGREVEGTEGRKQRRWDEHRSLCLQNPKWSGTGVCGKALKLGNGEE